MLYEVFYFYNNSYSLQDYGPKVNFKRQKVKLGSFNGLPPFSERVVKRMQSELEELRDFTPVELCNLDYSPERGSAIDPHMDDSWIWGERLVTINLLSPTYLTFSNSIKSRPSDLHTTSVKVLHCVSMAYESVTVTRLIIGIPACMVEVYKTTPEIIR